MSVKCKVSSEFPKMINSRNWLSRSLKLTTYLINMCFSRYYLIYEIWYFLVHEIWYFLALFCVSCEEISWCFLLFPVERNVAHTSDLQKNYHRIKYQKRMYHAANKIENRKVSKYMFHPHTYFWAEKSS